MKLKNRTLLLLLVVIAATSCKKNVTEQQEVKRNTVDPSKVFKLPSTEEEKELVENLGKITEVFKKLYLDNANLKLVNAAILSKAYTDQSILLKDLIYPAESRLNKVEKFRRLSTQLGLSLQRFSDNFWNIVNKENDRAFINFLGRLKPDATAQVVNRTTIVDDSQISIYFPYIEQFHFDENGSFAPITTLTTATADADEGIGTLPYYVNGIFQYNIQVIVNDDYVYDNPTHIIGVNGIDFDQETNGPPPPPPPPPGVSRVFIGHGLCKKQYDRLISFTGNGGGSEIKYCHMSGYLQPVNGQVTTFQDIASVNFSRGDIRNKRWLVNNIVWDDDWVPADLEQFFAIYEEDNTHSITFNGSVGTTVTITPGTTGTGTIGFAITKQSQDDIIRQLKISRNSYFSGAFQDQGWGFNKDYIFLPPPVTHGWPYYDALPNAGADVGWTWPYNTF